MMLSSLRSQRGLTFVEVMVSILILCVVMIGGFSFFVFGRRDISRSGHYRQALELANQMLEEAKADGYGSLSPGTTDEGTVTLDDVDYTRYISLPDPITSEITEVTVSVWCQEVGYSVSLTTLIADY